jgi:hypothetical protein
MFNPDTHVISRRLAACGLAAALLACAPAASLAQPTELFISEYVEGTSNNKALEIYNGTGAAINLATGGYNIQMYFNGSASAGLTINLTGTVADGDVYVLAQASAVAAILAQADQTNGAGWFNGDDAVVLRKGTTIVDTIGQVGFDPGAEWGTLLVSTADNTLRRKTSVCAGDANGADLFDPSLDWDGFAIDSFGDIGVHTVSCASSDAAPEVSTVSPANGATGVALGASLTVTFSEPVSVADPWFSLACAVTGPKTAVVSGGPTTFTIDPDSDFAYGENCTVTIAAAQVSDQDANDPPDAMAGNYAWSFTVVAFDPCLQPYTPIPAIQGSGASAAITGVVTTRGVVVGDSEYPGSGSTGAVVRGFFIQDAAGDGDPATSDGIFVFNGNNNSVALGDVVYVTGTAGEFQGQTQLSSVTAITKCGTATVAPVDVTLPLSAPGDLERFEGMLVRFPQTLHVTEHFQLGRFGQVVLSSGDRLQQPTDVVAPGAPALALQAQNDLDRIILDDALQVQNPDPIVFARGAGPLSAANTLRGGDTATGIVGVLSYTWGGNAASPNAYRVRPINALGGAWEFVAGNPRPETPPVVGGSLRVAGMNLLNFFNTFDGLPDTVDNCTLGVGGPATDCRGADTASELARQIPKAVSAVLGTGADAVGLVELENDGYGPESAVQYLVDQLNAATAPGTWAFIDADAGTGAINALGEDAIKVGLIYKPARLTPVGQTAALNTVAFVNGGDSAPRNRASLAQAFEEAGTGARTVLVVNHLKSKGSACDAADAGDGQGNCNTVRTNAAYELAAWLATDPTGAGTPRVLLLGDFNSYAKEDPIAALEAAGYTNLADALLGDGAYSYVFDGQWGSLDHALASAALVPRVTGVAVHHTNADEPSVLDYNTDFKSAGQIASLYTPDQYRNADHDPVVVGLDLFDDPPTANAGGPYQVDENATVTLSATGADPEGTAVTFAWDLDDDGTFETPGQSVSFPAVTGSIDGPGSYAVHVQVTDAGGVSAVADATVSVLNVVPVVTASPSLQSVQYSDPVVPVVFTATDVAADIPLAAAASFSVNGGAFGAGVPDGLSWTNACVTTSCTWTLEGTVQAAPGAYVVRLTVIDKDGGTNWADAAITVLREDARATYTGALFASTSSSSSSVATVTLAATILDISATSDAAGDTWAGDIRNATVAFVNRDAGDAVLCTAPVGLVSAADLTVGTAACDWTVDLGSAASISPRIGIVVDGYYTRNATAEDTIVTISKSIGTNFITGGGYLVLESAAGAIAGDDVSRMNVGFNVKPNKSRSNFQGRLNAIVRRAGRVYQIKSTAIWSLTVNPASCEAATEAAPCAAVFTGKAVITDVTDAAAPLPVDGGATLQVTMTDRGEPGRSDTIAVTVWNRSGGLWFASRWDGVRTLEQALDGGNLIVH